MKKVLDFLELNNIKENKGYFITRIILSLLIGISYFLDSILMFKQPTVNVYWSNSLYKYVYFEKPDVNNFLILIVVTIISFLLISIIGYSGAKYKDKFKNNNNKKKKYSIYFIIFFSILKCGCHTF